MPQPSVAAALLAILDTCSWSLSAAAASSVRSWRLAERPWRWPKVAADLASVSLRKCRRSSSSFQRSACRASASLRRRACSAAKARRSASKKSAAARPEMPTLGAVAVVVVVGCAAVEAVEAGGGGGGCTTARAALGTPCRIIHGLLRY